MLFKYFLAALPLTLAGPITIPHAPIITPTDCELIPDKYIIKVKSDGCEKTVIKEAIKLLKNAPEHVYNFGSYKGFSAEIAQDKVKLVAALPGVAYIEQDAIMTANLAFQRRATVTQPSAPWGLARISHVGGGNSTNSTSYVYDESAGEGTCAYVIDTGIYTQHQDFEGRADFLVNYSSDDDNSDGNGHGTHIAGVIGSKTYGVAKKTKLFAVKVFNAAGRGPNSGVIAGINFAANDQKNRTGCAKGAVANLSFGGQKSESVDAAAANAIQEGLFLAVAAGNSGVDASATSPASEKTVYTVGAIDQNDRIATFSNYGPFVDIFAPGVDILSTWNDGSSHLMSGTSMACPHVAGLAAYILGLEGKTSATDLSSRLTALATKDIITGLNSNTVNALAFNGISSSPQGNNNSTGNPSPNPSGGNNNDSPGSPHGSNGYPYSSGSPSSNDTPNTYNYGYNY